ncbi:MAG: OmpA family protein [Brumimicrobium sp.]|nr:OmpA family protein [Brumimicrobium sp.]
MHFFVFKKSLFKLTIAFLTVCFSTAGQTSENRSENIADCFGAIELPLRTAISPVFTGMAGEQEDLKPWAQKLQLIERNALWFNFVAPFDGNFSFGGNTEKEPVEILVFRTTRDENCDAILSGKAELVNILFINENNRDFQLEEIKLGKEEKIFICINTSDPNKSSVHLTADFVSSDKEAAINSMMKIEDLRKDNSVPKFHLKFRDSKTGLPVNARIIISESKGFNAMYKASDMYLNKTGNLKFNLVVDAEGYFFKDLEINIRDEEQTEHTILMDPLEKGQQIELEGIRFKPQSAAFTEEAKPKLRRLRDFLAVNQSVNIEIQGHVLKYGRNSWRAIRLSSKRAREVKKYLVENGIDENRLSTVGFGNSKMKYPKPENDEQKQANRRVEIKIK